MTELEMEAYLSTIAKKIRVTKVVASRSVKGKRGDSFAGFATGYNSVQEEPLGVSKDLISTAESQDQGFTLQESRVAYYLLAMQTDISAYESAMANGELSAEDLRSLIPTLRLNYGTLIRRALLSEGPNEE